MIFFWILSLIIIYRFDMKENFIKVLKFVLRYLLPAFVGWLEGDSHAVADIISSLLLGF